jgi:hypothetical protein
LVLDVNYRINNATEYATGLAHFAEAYKRERHRMPFFIWRDSSVQHFNHLTGDYDVNGNQPPCMPIGLNLTSDAVVLQPDGRLTADRAELQVPQLPPLPLLPS